MEGRGVGEGGGGGGGGGGVQVGLGSMAHNGFRNEKRKSKVHHCKKKKSMRAMTSGSIPGHTGKRRRVSGGQSSCDRSRTLPTDPDLISAAERDALHHSLVGLKFAKRNPFLCFCKQIKKPPMTVQDHAENIQWQVLLIETHHLLCLLFPLVDCFRLWQCRCLIHPGTLRSTVMTHCKHKNHRYCCLSFHCML